MQKFDYEAYVIAAIARADADGDIGIDEFGDVTDAESVRADCYSEYPATGQWLAMLAIAYDGFSNEAAMYADSWQFSSANELRDWAQLGCKREHVYLYACDWLCVVSPTGRCVWVGQRISWPHDEGTSFRQLLGYDDTLVLPTE